MEDNSIKALNGDALNQKRKMAIQCVAHLTKFSTTTNLVINKMRLVGDEGQPTDSGLGISRSLDMYYLNYKKSGLPKRLMFYKNGEWSDYSKDVIDLVKKDFEIKKAVVEVELDGQKVMMDFLHMYNVNLETGLRQPIAWIDEAKSCFFPEFFAGSGEETNNLGEEKDVESHGMKEAHELKLGENSGESADLSIDVDVGDHDTTNKVGNKNIAVNDNQYIERDLDAHTEPGYGSLDVNFVRNIFLTGMASFDLNDEDIVDIYRNSGILMQAHTQLFQKQADNTKGIHGDANVRYGWLACSKEELSMMMKYGLCHKELSSSKCIHLAAITHPYVCAPYCDVDENGVKHLVLCRVIMGNMEPLRRGNKHICPSVGEYDNGIDDIECPYGVWNINMDTHIYPEFVVSFKAPIDVEGNERPNENMKDVYENKSSTLDTVNTVGMVTDTQTGPRSLWLPFPMLFAAIRSRVPPRMMLFIKGYYDQFMADRLSREDFVMNMRLLAGDNILRSAVTNLP